MVVFLQAGISIIAVGDLGSSFSSTVNPSLRNSPGGLRQASISTIKIGIEVGAF